MPLKNFLAFIMPSFVAMILFIATPLFGVVGLSLYNSFTKITFEEVVTRTPLGEKKDIRPVPQLDSQGKPIIETNFVGTQHFNTILQPQKLKEALQKFTATSLSSASLYTFYNEITRIPFWGALEFTLLYAALSTPFILLLGFFIALFVNETHVKLKGGLIFISLLPFIITPVVGSLAIKWLFLDNAIITVWLKQLGFGQIYFLQSAFSIRFLILLYGVWHVMPFAFIVFYAGLQTVPQDLKEAAISDGASSWQINRYVIIPHLMPLILFVLLIHLMDAYRLFEPILVFSGGQGANSVQYLTYYLLDIEQNFHKASASAILTLVGICAIILPLLINTYKEHKRSLA